MKDLYSNYPQELISTSKENYGDEETYLSDLLAQPDIRIQETVETLDNGEIIKTIVESNQLPAKAESAIDILVCRLGKTQLEEHAIRQHLFTLAKEDGEAGDKARAILLKHYSLTIVRD